MLRGNPPPPPPNIPFFLFLSISLFLHFSKKICKFRGGGFEPPEPPPPLNTSLQLTLYDPALKAPPPPIFCPHAFNFGTTLLCVGDVSQKKSLTPCGKTNFLIVGYDLAVTEVSKYKVDMIFIIFREFNTMLEIVDS